MVLVGLLLSEVSVAQKFRHRKEKQNKEYKKKPVTVFPDINEYHHSGWQFHLGPTFTATRPFPITQTNSEGDPVKNNPKGGLALWAGGGRYRMLEYSYLFKYFDYGINYKWLRGKLVTEPGGERKFSDHEVGTYINFHNIIDVRDIGYIQNSIGLNLDYTFVRSPKTGDRPDPYIAQLHYKLGFGWKPARRLMTVIGVETPVISAWPGPPWPWFNFFSHKYQPLLFTIKFIFLRPVQDVCPPVYNPAMPSLEEMQKQMNQGK